MAGLVDAMADKNAVEARLAALRLRIARGELVPRREFEARCQAIGLRMRDRVMAAPARHGSVLAARYAIDPAALGIVLEQIVRGALENLAANREDSAGQ